MPTSRDILLEAALPGGRAARAFRTDGLVVVQNWQDVVPVLRDAELAREIHNAAAVRKNAGGFVRVGTIPVVIVEELKRKGIWQDRKRLLAWLQHPDNRKWRTDDGRRLV